MLHVVTGPQSLELQVDKSTVHRLLFVGLRAILGGRSDTVFSWKPVLRAFLYDWHTVCIVRALPSYH